MEGKTMWKHYLTAILRLPEDGDGASNGGGGTEGGGEKPAETETKGGAADAENGGQGEEKQFTQADIDRVVAERMAAKEKTDKEAKEKADKESKMSAEARAEAKEREADDRIKAAEEKAKMAEYRADLAGKVTRPEAAMKLFDAEKHLTNGKADPVKFLRDNPEFAVKAADTSSGGVGGQHNRSGDKDADSWGAAVEADRKAGRYNN